MFALHRLVLWITLSIASLLSACGSGTTFEPLVPSRVISFGDGISDVGQSGAKFTVNDGSVNIWVERVATDYGRTLTAAVSGGLGFARGGARVNTGANSIADQITAFLAANTIGVNDLLIIDAGIAELASLSVDHANASDATLIVAGDAAGRALALQALRLTAAGGKHVVIANAPDLSKTPLANNVPPIRQRVAAYAATTRAFNDGLKIGLANVNNNILLIDNEAYINILHSNPALLGSGGNVTVSACSVPVTTCTKSNAISNYNVYLYADDRHFAPGAQRLLGENATAKIKLRW